MSNLLIQGRQDGVTVIRIPRFSPETFQDWAALKQQLYAEAHATHQHLRILYDIRDAGWLSEEQVKLMRQYSYHSTSPVNRSLAILTLPVSLGLTERAISSLPKVSRESACVFISEDEAIHWLQSHPT